MSSAENDHSAPGRRPPAPRPQPAPVRPAFARDGQRPISAQQLAFVRAWAEGIDPAAAWLRFMAGGQAADARRARADLRQLREQLGALARSHGRPDIAALLRRDPEAIAAPRQAVPTLDEFRARQPPDFYSEDELVALYEAEHGRVDARSAARRRQRLRERLVLALQWLGRQVLREPVPDDAVAGWLDERVAARLASVGIRRLQDLQLWIAAHGLHWHRPVPRLGAIGAQRIVDWLTRHAHTLGALPASAHWPRHAIAQPAAPGREATPRSGLIPGATGATGVPGSPVAGPAVPTRAAHAPPAATRMPAPIEHFELPAGLDGTHGLHRAPAARCRIAARNDRQAVFAWLEQRPAGSHTWRSYRKEAERLLLWAVLCRGKALSSLQAPDLQAYCDFLGAPDPDWRAPRSTPRWSPAWRPFEGPLSPSSADTAIAVLRALFAWLTEQRYLDDNPWPAGAAASAEAEAVAETVAAVATPATSVAAAVVQGRAPASADRQWAGGLRPAPSTQFTPGTAGMLEGAPARALSAARHALVHQCLAARPGLAGARLRAVLHLLMGTGLRVSEVAAARLGWLVKVPAGASPGARAGAVDAAGQGGETGGRPAPAPKQDVWVLHVHGGGRAGRAHGGRAVAMPYEAAHALGVYLSLRELPADLSALDPQAPLIARLATRASRPSARSQQALPQAAAADAADAGPSPAVAAPLSAAQVRALLSRALAACAADLARHEPDTAAALCQMGAVALRRVPAGGFNPAVDRAA